jgi:uncharacterized Fe-S cluster protein YjdI
MQEYKNDKIAVRYAPKICIHAGECVRGSSSWWQVPRNGSREVRLAVGVEEF